MQRRGFLITTALATLGMLAGCADDSSTKSADGFPDEVASSNTAVTTVDSRVFSAPTGIRKVAVPHGTLYGLPGTGNNLALTVDDGTDPMVVAAYAKFCQDTGMRVTCFVNGINPGWTESKPTLAPMVDSGQVFLANHTWSHPDLTRLDAAGVTYQVQRNETFLKNNYGVLGRPFLRPPFGYGNDALHAQLADLGYPAVTMWLGSLSDATVIAPQRVVFHAKQWFLAQHIVIGHANHPAVTHVYGQLVDIIRERKLQPVTLADIFQV
ncbi:peptidoglycan/xylan/chitin deacetylase (PgdA/CDA1 family) [Rudaeicoccus suwonensis]|uniref:Peptidoglycan/xylan/chitin deacetylase (PgdA/CDA1 family) n=1 Tax=Rudaeicoccus suwonensis TaxID=657409 RepID=A0A561E3N5_9MICO|nr:peptidoglycan/xylan/chitin deacetylase (PgdA/CDA1 family) [Rudaeicoccus suwonensis]